MKGFWATYTWRQKNRFLWWGSLLFLFIVYQMSVKKTLALRSAYCQASTAQVNMQQKEMELSRLKARKQQVGRVGAIDETNKGNLKASMLNLVASAADNNQLVIKDVPATKTVAADGLTVNYDEYCIMGSYDKLLQCWYEIEKSKELNMVSVSFRKENNALTKEPELKMYLTTAYVAGN